MRRLQPEFLVPSHTQPVIGRDKVTKQLTDYRDGIQWVYTATVRVRPQASRAHFISVVSKWGLGERCGAGTQRLVD